MKRSVSALAAVIVGASGGMLAGGCGSSTKTVSVAGNPPVTTGATGATGATTGPTQTSTGPSTTSAPGSTNGAVQAPSSTHSAPEPAFTQKEGTAAEGASAAAAVVRANGFTPNNTSDYHSNQALRVLVGTRTGSGDGYGQQAFFFVNGRYIGTDTKQPSATLRVVSQGDTEVTLSYPLYRKGDPLSTPSGQAQVRFQLNNGRLVPLDAIPPASARY